MTGLGRLLFASLLACGPGAGTAKAQEIEAARFIGPTRAYDHAILGDDIEYSGMSVTHSGGQSFLVGFSEGGRVFEDIAPRLWDVTGDGAPEIVVIETDPAVGAQLAVYGLRRGRIEKIAATPHIGQTHRWLAPVGAADLDGDGRIELAYVDRPHLAKILRIWRIEGGRLRQVAAIEGFTNHRIGWSEIPGGVRDCGQGPEMIVADADWRNVVALRWTGKRADARAIARFRGPDSLTRGLRCP